MGSNGAEAIQLYKQHQPDLVLMDIRMGASLLGLMQLVKFYKNILSKNFIF